MCLTVELCMTPKAPKLLLQENDIQGVLCNLGGNPLIMKVLFSRCG